MVTLLLGPSGAYEAAKIVEDPAAGFPAIFPLELNRFLSDFLWDLPAS